MARNRLVLLLAAAPLLIGGLGFAVSGKAVADPGTAIAQDSSQPGGQREGGGHQRPDFAQLLGLTDDQQAQLKQIHESTHQQMDAVFTAEQKEQLRLARQQHQRPNLNLSDDQKAQIDAIRQDAKSKMDAILTDQQKQKLQEMHQQRMQHREQQ